MKTKTDMFFEMLQAHYGVSKMRSSWPTEMDLQLAKKLFEDAIEKYTEQELAGALSRARSMMSSGDDEWIWPNVGLILSCIVKRTDNILPRYRDETPEERERMRLHRIDKMAQLRKEVGL